MDLAVPGRSSVEVISGAWSGCLGLATERISRLPCWNPCPPLGAISVDVNTDFVGVELVASADFEPSMSLMMPSSFLTLRGVPAAAIPPAVGRPSAALVVIQALYFVR